MRKAVAMDNSLHDWAERLATVALPVLDETRQQVSQLLNRQNSSNADLQRVIIRDPGYALALFRMLNQLPNAPREPVSTLSHALALLGTDQISQATQQLPGLKDYPAGEPRKALLAGYSRAGHAACYVAAWGRILGFSNTEELATAALFSDLAALLLWNQATRQMEQVELMTRRGQARIQAEQSLFGFQLNQLSLALAEGWGLSNLVSESLQPTGAFQTRSLAVMLAATLARESSQDWYSSQTLQLIELVAELTRTGLDQAAAGVHTLAAEAARALHTLPLPLAISGLMPGMRNKPPEHNMRRDDRKLSRKTGPTADGAPPPALIPDKSLTVSTCGSASPAKGPASTRQQRLESLLRELKVHTGVERVMVALLNGDGSRLTAKYITGASKSAALRRFQHPVEGRHLFSLMLKKPLGVWLNPDNRQKLLPLLSDEARQTLNTDGFYISSLFVKNRPLGILYAERDDPAGLDRQGFSQFKTVARQLANELSEDS